MEQSHANGAGGRGLMDRVKDSATAQLSTQKSRATDGLGSLASTIRQSSQPFRDGQQDMIAQYVEKAADQLERLSTHLRDRDVSDLMDDAQRFARRQPAVFVGAAFAVGVVAARFLKSSSSSANRDNREALTRYEPGTAGYPAGPTYASGRL